MMSTDISAQLLLKTLFLFNALLDLFDFVILRFCLLVFIRVLFLFLVYTLCMILFKRMNLIIC